MPTKTTDIVASMVEMLSPLSSEDRRRVVQAVLTLIGEASIDTNVHHAGGKGADGVEDETDLPARAKAWIKQYQLTTDELLQVFHIADGEVEVIASEIPGRGMKLKTYNAYLLSGIAKLLSTGEPSFDDKSARELCVSSGCYDKTNHGKYMRKKGNEIAGTKDKGWKLTAPGLKRAAELVKELSK